MAANKDVITKGIDYWLDAGCRRLEEYGKEGRRLATLIKTKIGQYKDADTKILAGKFKACMSFFAAALWQLDGQEGLYKFNEIMNVALPSGYEASYGNVRGSGLDGFLQYVVDRDRMLGYDAGGRKISNEEFEYWIADPFVNLKNIMPEHAYEVISTFGYVSIKINFFFDDAENWFASLEESPWRGHSRSLWRITRRRQIKLRHQTRAVEAYA